MRRGLSLISIAVVCVALVAVAGITWCGCAEQMKHRIEQWEQLRTVPTYLKKRSSCYSCERAFAPGEEWRGQPSKCFSCEADLANRGGDPFMASRTIV